MLCSICLPGQHCLSQQNLPETSSQLPIFRTFIRNCVNSRSWLHAGVQLFPSESLYMEGLFSLPKITAIPHKERLATLYAVCLQISLQSLFRIFSHAFCVHIFRDISGKYSKIHKGFSPFFPSSLKKSDDAICIRQIRNRLSYFTKMLVNTASIHSAFCFI